MQGTNRFFLIVGCLILLTGVQLGALGSHALDAVLTPKKLESWSLAVQYQLIHGLGLLIASLLADNLANPKLLKWSQGLLLAGIIMFSGSIYLTALGAPGWIGTITPFGGLTLMLAWLLLAIGIYRSQAGQ